VKNKPNALFNKNPDLDVNSTYAFVRLLAPQITPTCPEKAQKL